MLKKLAPVRLISLRAKDSSVTASGNESPAAIRDWVTKRVGPHARRCGASIAVYSAMPVRSGGSGENQLHHGAAASGDALMGCCCKAYPRRAATRYRAPRTPRV